MKKNFIFVIVAVVLIPAALCGCGKKSYFESSAAIAEAKGNEAEHGDSAGLRDSETGGLPGDRADVAGATGQAGAVGATDQADAVGATDGAGASDQSAPAPQEVVVKVYVYNDDGKARVSVEGAEAFDRSGLVDINTATRDQLMTLSGIGESKADAIISYREEQGGFSTEDDLKKVSGIGDGTYEKIKDKITV